MSDLLHRPTMMGALLAAASMSLGMPVALRNNRFDDLDMLEDQLDTLKRILPSGRRSRKVVYPQHPTAKRSTVKAARKANVRRMQRNRRPNLARERAVLASVGSQP